MGSITAAWDLAVVVAPCEWIVAVAPIFTLGWHAVPRCRPQTCIVLIDFSGHILLQSNLEAVNVDLKDEDFHALCQLKHQQQSVPAAGFLKPETGPYSTEEDVWDKGFPGGL